MTMVDPERIDPIENLIADFLARRARGERVEPEEFARQNSGGDEGARTRILSAIRAAPRIDATIALDAEAGGTVVLGKPTTSDASTGRRIDNRYVVERQLGEGGFGVVYLVRDEVHRGNLRALKTLHAQLAQDADLSQRFRNEIITVKAISHRYVPRFHNDGATGDGGLYYVMDYVDGVRLDDVLRKVGPLAPERIVQLVRQILDVLEFAHQKGVYHRDLKPANIILVKAGTPEEEVRVLDFGIAKITSREGEFSEMESMHTMSGGAIGTPHYMAPEQVTGQGKVDGKTDLYALGVIIYQMCSGRVPFTGKTSMEVAAARLTQAPPPLDEDTPEWLRTLVMRLLERQKDKRPGTEELRVQLEGISGGQSEIGRTLKWVAALGVAIALGVAWMLWTGNQKDEPDVVTRGSNDGDPAPTAQIPKHTPSVTFAPIAFQSPADSARFADPDIDVAVEARGRQRIEIGDREVEVGADGFARAKIRVPTDQPARIRIRDEDGAEIGTRSVFVDTRAPMLVLDVPEGVIESGGRWLTSRRQLEISGSITDGDGGSLSAKPLLIGKDQPQPVDAGGRFRATFVPMEGANEFVVRATDAVGLVTTVTHTLIGDFTDPVIRFTTPLEPTSSDRVRIDGVVTDITGCTSSIVRAGAADHASPLVLDVNGRFSQEMSLVSGRNEFTVEARDAVDHVARKVFAIERTRTAASVATIEPASGRSLSAADATVRVSATTNVRPSRVEVTRGGSRLDVVAKPTAEGFTIELPLAFGANVFQLVPYDEGGQPGASFDLTYVRVAPAAPAGCTIPADTKLDERGRPRRVVHARSNLEFVLVPGDPRIPAFYIAIHEFTVGDMSRLGAGFYAEPENRPEFWDDIASDRESHPAVLLPFDRARGVCRDLGLRLPTPREWECAAGVNDGRDYPWGASWIAGACNADEKSDGFPHTAPVGSFPQDIAPCGAFDMGGNVSEWCASESAEKPEIRGGSWNSTADSCRITFRRNVSAKKATYLGFRPALDAPVLRE